jgi:hypothetical protein
MRWVSAGIQDWKLASASADTRLFCLEQNICQNEWVGQRKHNFYGNHVEFKELVITGNHARRFLCTISGELFQIFTYVRKQFLLLLRP